MNKHSCKQFDVVIVGGGIGGLVCGCYLVKKGLKVLIVEKNFKVGGYCTSFAKDGYVFNSCVRGVVGCKKDGILYKILQELSLYNNINFLRPPVYDEIRFLSRSLALYNDPEETKQSIKRLFPREAFAIDNFFKLLCDGNDIFSILSYRKRSFQELLEEYFIDRDLIFLFSVLRIDSGKSPSQTSALSDLMLIRGNILDGGYMPTGGVQVLPDAFSCCFESQGGELILGEEVKQIIVEKNVAKGILLRENQYIRARVIISACDITHTLDHLMPENSNVTRLKSVILNKEPSISAFLLYLGLREDMKSRLMHRCSAVWRFPRYIEDKEYNFDQEVDLKSGGVVCLFPSIVDPSLAPSNCTSVVLYLGMPFKSKFFWEKNKDAVADLLLHRFCSEFQINKSNIYFMKIATPIDLKNITNNRSGASRGWASKIDLTSTSWLKPEGAVLHNYYHCGHWVLDPFGGGVSFVANNARSVAKRVIVDWREK